MYRALWFYFTVGRFFFKFLPMKTYGPTVVTLLTNSVIDEHQVINGSHGTHNNVWLPKSFPRATALWHD